MKLKQNMWIMPAMRRGAIMRGRRTRRATRVEKQIDPKRVVVEWCRAADMIALEEVVGMAWR